jgi:hypothetical protein
LLSEASSTLLCAISKYNNCISLLIKNNCISLLIKNLNENRTNFYSSIGTLSNISHFSSDNSELILKEGISKILKNIFIDVKSNQKIKEFIFIIVKEISSHSWNHAIEFKDFIEIIIDLYLQPNKNLTSQFLLKMFETLKSIITNCKEVKFLINFNNEKLPKEILILYLT